MYGFWGYHFSGSATAAIAYDAHSSNQFSTQFVETPPVGICLIQLSPTKPPGRQANPQSYTFSRESSRGRKIYETGNIRNMPCLLLGRPDSTERPTTFILMYSHIFHTNLIYCFPSRGTVIVVIRGFCQRKTQSVSVFRGPPIGVARTYLWVDLEGRWLTCFAVRYDDQN